MRDYAREKRNAKHAHRAARRRGRPITWATARALAGYEWDPSDRADRKPGGESKSSRRVNRKAWRQNQSRIERNIGVIRDDRHTAAHAKAKALAQATAHRKP